jgi:predicted Zn-dependent protease
MKIRDKSLLCSLSLLIVASSANLAAYSTSIAQSQPIQPTSRTAPLNQAERQQLLEEGDKLYLGGQYQAAQELYRQAKPPFTANKSVIGIKPAIYNPQQLSPSGKVYWRIAQAGLKQGLESKIFIPLKSLVEKYPEFIPGHIEYAKALQSYNRQSEAIASLERATSLYPTEINLVKTSIKSHEDAKRWLEASLAARHFVIFNPNSPQVPELTKVAEENLKRYQSSLRVKQRENTIANVLTGAVSYAVSGNFLGLVSGIETTALLLEGESAVGEKIAARLKDRLDLITDPQVSGYVDEIGTKIALIAGRNDFKYEFYLVKDDSLNAFALPGGKIFINAGAILKANSEAEFAGLLAHEISHAVLSHGFELATEGSLTANLGQFLPYGSTLANLIVLDYSRDMERQADILGTRLLANSGYAADGLWNMMVTLDKEKEGRRSTFAWLSSHPPTLQRIAYLQGIIEQYGYNRYAFEGVTRHSLINTKLPSKKVSVFWQTRGHGDRNYHLRVQLGIKTDCSKLLTKISCVSALKLTKLNRLLREIRQFGS